MCQKPNLLISKLKETFFALNIHAIVIPASDPHQSEYLADHWKLREWISGFTGSAGSVVITRTESGLWTDSRYFLQAEEELSGSDIKLFRDGQEGTLTINEYLLNSLDDGQRVAINPLMWSHNAIEGLRKKLSTKNIEVVIDQQLVENLWNQNNRPALPSSKIFIHKLKHAELSVAEKLEVVREQMKKEKVGQHLVTTLDDIAWQFNLRGYDIAHNPVFLSYAIIRSTDAILFIDPIKLSQEVIDHLSVSQVSILPYTEIEDHLLKIKEPILVNPQDCNELVYASIPDEHIVKGSTISRLIKAQKPASVIAHIEHAMVKDGIALAHAFYELYQNIGTITEAEFATLIATKRSEQKDYYGESFPAIVGYQANGAIVHYRPKTGSSAIIQAEGLLLCDSGGQYFDGTTDITRTIAVGPVTQEQKESYTCVLKGHIAIDQAVFPKGTTGGQLDPLARQFLWAKGLDYGHGTGHGVGYFLNVHEPPQGISPGTGSRTTTALAPGMFTSNEPGYYKEGAYGIRIENLIICEETDHKGYLKHRHLTLFPLDTSIIVQEMLTRDEVDWLNNYHELVATKLLPHLTGEVADWVEKACSSI